MEHDEQPRTVRRLHALGTRPVDPDVAARHEAYLAAATAAPTRSRMRPLVAGSLLAGALLGGTGLAAALPGSLPERAGSVARQVLAAAQLVDDEDDAGKKAEQEARKAARAAAKAQGARGTERFLDGCTVGDPPEPFTGNHGQYVRAHPDDPATPDVNERQVAAESDCGKPLVSLGGDDEGEEAEDTQAGEAEAGPPEGKLTGPERAAEAKAEAEARKAEAGGAQPAETGRPESPGNSEGPKPPPTAANQQGSENRATERGSSDDAGSSADRRPEGVGPPTSAP
ncbi:MAG TPA: hypothetical protein VM263_07110 [Acidimicrobiales bacterium]|nr:hypothetical protein [Acidimicrobiales bacterium]